MYSKQQLNLILNKYICIYIIEISIFAYKINIKFNLYKWKWWILDIIFVKKWFDLFKSEIKCINSLKNFNIFCDKDIYSQIHQNDILILDKLLKNVFDYYDKTFYFSEIMFLDKLIFLDWQLKNKILIISDMPHYQPINYLFRYNNFKNINFIIENTEIKWFFDKIIIIYNFNFNSIINNINNKKLNTNQLIVIWLNDLVIWDNFYNLLKNIKHSIIYPSTYRNQFDKYIYNKDKIIFNNKIHNNFISKIDLFWCTEKILLYKSVYEQYDIDLLINCWPARNYKLILDNYIYFKNKKCVFYNIDHIQAKQSNTLKKLQDINNTNHQFIWFLWWKLYYKYLYRSKIVFIPSTITWNSGQTHWTWTDAMLYWKACILTASKRVLEFKRKNKDWIVNFETFSNDQEMLDKIEKILNNTEYRKQIEKYALESFSKDFSIERILLDVIK